MRSSSRSSRKGIKAWLVTWEWAGDHAEPERKIAAILNPRWSSGRVREYVEFLYVNSWYSIPERIRYANNRSFNPYPAKFHLVNGVPWADYIRCGDNPYLYARRVNNLAATGEPDDEEAVVWDKRPKPDFDNISRVLGIGRDKQA